jgi:hypothetical protein
MPLQSSARSRRRRRCSRHFLLLTRNTGAHDAMLETVSDASTIHHASELRTSTHRMVMVLAVAEATREIVALRPEGGEIVGATLETAALDLVSRAVIPATESKFGT